MGIRDKFAECFGERQTELVEQAAWEHGNGINNKNLGSDPFKWVLLICIGYDCLSKPSFAEQHGITLEWPVVKEWIIQNAELGSHDGDCDYVSLCCGIYNEFVGRKTV